MPAGLLTLDKFFSHFPKLEITREEFTRKLIVTYKGNPTLYDIFNFKESGVKIIKSESDPRYINRDRIIDYFYDIIVVHRYEYLENFYHAYFEFPNPNSMKWDESDGVDIIHKTSKGHNKIVEYLKSNKEWLQSVDRYISDDSLDSTQNILKVFDKMLDVDKLVISLQKNDNSRRMVRNLNYLEILHTTSVINTCKSKTSFWESIMDIYNKLILADRMFAPSSIAQFFEKKNLQNELNYNAFFYLFQGYQPKASILNPYTINWLLKNKLQPLDKSLNKSLDKSLNTLKNGTNSSKRLLTPVLSWCSYIIAFMHTDWTDYVGIDVIPDVIDRTKFVYDYYREKNYGIDPMNKTIDLYCKPSESLLNDKVFIGKYKEYFDTILLCPPYYNMEIYKDGEQSTKLYKTYNEWLDKYWENTVAMCSIVLAKGGKFAFIVNNYHTLAGDHYDLISDLNLIAMKYFTLIDVIQLHNRGSPLRMNHKDRTEMLFIWTNSP